MTQFRTIASLATAIPAKSSVLASNGLHQIQYDIQFVILAHDTTEKFSAVFYVFRHRLDCILHDSVYSRYPVDDEPRIFFVRSNNDDSRLFVSGPGGESEALAEIDHREHGPPERYHAQNIVWRIRHDCQFPVLEYLLNAVYHQGIFLAAEPERENLDFLCRCLD